MTSLTGFRKQFALQHAGGANDYHKRIVGAETQRSTARCGIFYLPADALSMARQKRLLAVASGGGHWVQLQRMREAFEGFDVAYVSTFKGHAEGLSGSRVYTVPDSSRIHKMAFLRSLLLSMRILLIERPQVVISTGSAPGLPFIIGGRAIGARTLWVDSIANGERLSASGRIARRFAHQTISQWAEVAEREGIPCWGSIL